MAATGAVAIASQATYGLLVAKADDDEVSITAQMGVAVYVVNWVAAACALAGCVLRFIANRQIGDGTRGAASGRGGHGFVRIVADEAETEYKYTGGTGKGKERAVSVSETLIAPSPGIAADISRNASEEDLSAIGNDGDRKYEPYRPTKV